MITETILAKAVDWVWAVVLGLIAFAWRHIEKRHIELDLQTEKRVADLRSDQDRRIMELSLEVGRQRDVAAKIFDKLDAMSRESADRHERLLQALHEGLAGKVDK